MKPNTTTCFSVACLLLIPSLTGFTVLPQKQTSVLALRASVADNVVEKQTKAQELSKEAQELLDVLVGDKKHDYDLVIAQTAPSVRYVLAVNHATSWICFLSFTKPNFTCFARHAVLHFQKSLVYLLVASRRQ